MSLQLLTWPGMCCSGGAVLCLCLQVVPDRATTIHVTNAHLNVTLQAADGKYSGGVWLQMCFLYEADLFQYVNSAWLVSV